MHVHKYMYMPLSIDMHVSCSHLDLRNLIPYSVSSCRECDSTLYRDALGKNGPKMAYNNYYAHAPQYVTSEVEVSSCCLYNTTNKLLETFINN